MGEDAESDFAIPFVDENDYSKISAKAVSAKPKLKKNLKDLKLPKLYKRPVSIDRRNLYDNFELN